MCDSLISVADKIWPPLLAVIVTHLFIKFKMPQIKIIPEKKEGNTYFIKDFNTGETKEEYRAWRFLILNKKMPCFLGWLLQRETATNCYAKLKISNSGKEFIMRGRWSNSPQISHIAEQDQFERMLYPDPISILSGKGREEHLDCIVQFPGEKIAYGWNNEAYFRNWRTPAYGLKEGNYKVLVSITPQNGKEVEKEFKLTVCGDLSKTTLE